MTPCDGFFSDDITRVVVATRASPSAGVIQSGVIFAYADAPHRDGIWSERIFGSRRDEPDERRRRWAHIELAAPCLHPAMVGPLAELLECAPEAVLALARHEAWWHAGKLYAPPGSAPALAPGAPIWEWEPPAVEELEPGLRDLHRVNAKLRRLGALPDWAKEHFGAEADWYDQALGGTGHHGLAAALAALTPAQIAELDRRHGVAPSELLVRVVPVPPPGDRPFVTRPGGFEQPGAKNLALARLAYENTQLAHHELDQLLLALREAERSLQLAFEEVVYRLSGRVPDWLKPQEVERVPGVGGEPPVAEYLPSEHFFGEPDRNGLRTTFSLALSGDRALVALATATFAFELGDSRVAEPMVTTGLNLLGLAPDAEHAVFFDPQRHRLHVLELATRRWHEALPDFLRFSVLSCSESEAKLIEASSRRASPLLRSLDLILSACGRFYMERIDGSQSPYLSDGWVVRSFDGEPVCEPLADVRERPLSWLSEAGTSRTFDHASEAEERCRPAVEATARAVVLAASGELLTLLDGMLIRGRDPVCGFAFSIDAAAFDPEGARLLLASKKTLTLLDVRDVPRITAQWDIRPLLDQMASSRARGSLVALGAALCRYGTLSNVARQAPSDLLSLSALDESWESHPIAAAEARRIQRMARRAPAVTRLNSIKIST